MELTLDQALQKGVEAHKAGQVQEADRLYTAILKAQPEHPYANHNMGVITVGIGKVEEALPLFKTALEANPNTAQFWLSYIDALIKLDRLPDAKAIFDQAKDNGATGEAFDQFEKWLNVPKGVIAETVFGSREVEEAQPNILDTLKLDQAINLAKKKSKKGSPEEAKRIYQDILVKFPKNKRAIDGMKGVSGGPIGKVSKVQDPPPDQLQSLINLYGQGQLQQALQQAEALVQQFPKSPVLFNIQGAVLIGLGQLDLSIEAFNKALAIKPDDAEAYNNMGNALQDQGKLVEATGAFKKALAIRPDNAEAYNNMGNALKEQGKLEESIEAYNKALAIKPDNAEFYYNKGVILKKQGKLEEAIEAYNNALAIKPDHVEAYNNMGNALQEQGKLEEAIEAFNKALALKPDYAEAIENSHGLAVQLLPITSNFGYESDSIDTKVNSKTAPRPKYQIQNAIKAYIKADFGEAHSHNNNFKACDQKLLGKLKSTDKVFCSGYSSFLEKLLRTKLDNAPVSEIENKVYHLGESHCLSYAHHHIKIDGSNYRVAPRITFGAKAFHFSQRKQNSFKAITKANFVSLPKSSKVFLSFGEIDCRPNEGFITSAGKLDKPKEQLITETILGYVQWFLEQNEGQSNNLYFINVPAPVYDKALTADLNSEVARTVSLFNAALKKYTLQHSFYMVDVFQFTVGKDGFSNDLFHVDKHHLGAKAIPKIEQQLN